jgi:hypothetical protein
MQAAVYGQHVELLRAQAVPPQQYFVSPLSIAGYGTAGINDTFLKLVNASDTYQHIRIFLLQERNPISLPIHELNLEPHDACQLAIDEMLRLRGVQLPERIAAGLGIETDQAGLVGFAWSTSMAKESSSYAWLLQAATCDNLPASFASIVAKSLCRE